MKLATAPLAFSGLLLVLGSDVVLRRQSTPTIFLGIANTQPITVCSSATISWGYLGPNVTMTLQITNNGVPQQGPASSSASPSQTLSNSNSAVLPTGTPPPNPITITLSTNILPANSSYFIWNPVNLNQGTYIANASFPSYDSYQVSGSSKSFLIQASNDTSCLSPASTPPATSSSATSTSSGTGSTGFPVRTSSSSTNTGAITGGVVGGVVFVLLILAFYLYFLRSKRTGRRAPASYSGGGGIFGIRQKGWGGLSSVDSGHGAPAYGAADTPQRQRSKLRSSKMHPNGDSSRQRQSVGVGEAAVNGPKEEETRSYRSANRFSPSKEKFSSSEEIVGMTTLAANGGKRQSDLTESSYNDHGFNGAVSGPRRWPSVHSTASLPVGARRPSIDLAHTPYVTSASVSTSQLPSSTSSPNAEVAPVVDHVASDASQQDRKKTPRKPVPVYTPSPAPSPPPQYLNPFPSDDFAPRIPSLVIPPINFNPEAGAKQKRSSGHYSMNSRSPATEQQLHHKSSFGIEGKPLHYLVPDMPLPPTT